MITVSILINSRPIYTRTARNIGPVDPLADNVQDNCLYLLDTGEVISHRQSAGAVVLAKKMLDTIKEP
ncbi:MAG: hypothetical protein KJ556_21775 [Gammaproteobacteria bacterium]|nr:hypothetical protein [Gammaproteobacteria bacterium]